MKLLEWELADKNLEILLISLSALTIVMVIQSMFHDLVIRDTHKLSARSMLNLVLMSSHSSLSRFHSIMVDFPLCIYGWHCRNGCRCEVALQRAVKRAHDSAPSLSMRAKLKILRLMGFSLFLRFAMLGLEVLVIAMTFTRAENKYMDNGKLALTLCVNSEFGNNMSTLRVIGCNPVLQRTSNASEYKQNTQISYCTRDVLSTYVDPNYNAKQNGPVRFLFTLDLTSDEANLNDARSGENKIRGAEIYALARSRDGNLELVEGAIPAVAIGEDYRMDRNDRMSAEDTAKWRKLVEADLMNKLGDAYESTYKSEAQWKNMTDEVPKTRMLFDIHLSKLPPSYTKDGLKYVSANLLNDIVCLKTSTVKDNSGIWHSTGVRVAKFAGSEGKLVENSIQRPILPVFLWFLFAGFALIIRKGFSYLFPTKVDELILDLYKDTYGSNYEEE